MQIPRLEKACYNYQHDSCPPQSFTFFKSDIDMRNKRILEDNRRQIEEAERSQREFEAKGRRG
jgi:hypothetical protein